MKILYSSAELRDAISGILVDPKPDERRVVMVAFVSGKAQAFLPDPKGLEVVCWLQPGSTDAVTLGRLKKRGATLFKSSRLHMKVYWSSHRGCVICSANASGNALGGGSQKETGVFLQPDVVDIERLWNYAEPQPISEGDLKRLAEQSDRIPRSSSAGGPKEPPPDFLEWHGLAGRREWKIGWWEGYVPAAKSVKETARVRYGAPKPFDWLNVAKGDVKPNDWLLMCKFPSGTGLSWLFVDFVVKVTSADKSVYEKKYPLQCSQVHRPDYYSAPPFTISKSFRTAFKEAVKSYGYEAIEKADSLQPSKRFLDLILKSMTASAE